MTRQTLPVVPPHPLPYRLIIFDADGTLRRCTVPGQPCPNRRGEWELLPNVVEVLRRYDWGGEQRMGIASNQAGIALGYLNEATALNLLDDLALAAIGRRLPIVNLQFCPHRPGENCLCRKPAPGMLRALMLVNRVPPAATLFVGDMDSDAEAARAAGCAFMWARDFFAWPAEESEHVD